MFSRSQGSSLEKITASLATVSEENSASFYLEYCTFLEQNNKPFSVTEKVLRSCYASLAKAADQYHPLSDDLTEELQRLYRSSSIVLFDCVEFQAQWHVLRQKDFSEDAIKSMRLFERSEQYLYNLYTFSDKFRTFFSERERAVENLAHAGFIAKEYYSRAEIITH